MNGKKNQDLDRIASDIRDEVIEESVVARAASRVRSRLADESVASPAFAFPLDRIEDCAGFQAIIPPYLRGSLPAPKVLLLEDHTGACIPCRRVLEAARGSRIPRVRRGHSLETPSNGVPRPVFRWAAAAAILIGVLLVGFGLRHRLLPGSIQGPARVLSVEGTLYRVRDGGIGSVAAGDAVSLGDSIRTAKSSRAVVLLADGSHVEMRERSEFAVVNRSDGTTLRLAMGSIIVQASPQGSGHLDVRTEDCLVSVTGTIFAVNHGLKGSRVSVIEGKVRVAHGQDEAVLQRGEQLSTDPSLGAVPVSDEIAWSRDGDHYVSLLRDLSALSKEIDRSVARPGLRHSTRLLDLAPAGTVVYAAIPNVSASLSEAHRLLREHIATSEPLREWWETKVSSVGGDAAIDQAIEKIHAFGDQIGDEIAMALSSDATGHVGGPILMAELKDPASFRRLLRREIRKAEGGKHPEVSLDIRGDLLLVSVHEPGTRKPSALNATSRSNPFLETSFHARLAETYRKGAGWLFGADMKRILKSAVHEAGNRGGVTAQEPLVRMGLASAEHLIVAVTEADNRTQHQALVTFDEPRSGLASWLAPPAPMGALGFISPEASLAAAFVVKNPSTLLQDVYNLLELTDPQIMRRLAEARSEKGLDLVEDLAASLGGGFAVALDGPVLPVPGWKLAAEVYDQDRLQRTVEALVNRANASSTLEDQQTWSGLRLERESVGGRTFFALRSDKPAIEVHYAIVDGYFLAGPRRVLLEQAIQQRASGHTLPVSSSFTSLLPHDGRENFSALLYQRLGPVLAPLTRHLSGSKASLTPAQRSAFESLAAESSPSLAYAYAEDDRIEFAANREGGLGTELSTLLGLGGAMELLHHPIDRESVGPVSGAP